VTKMLLLVRLISVLKSNGVITDTLP